MKRALVLQISARQKAETMHAEELQRRLALEHEAARLAEANRTLEAERARWTSAAVADSPEPTIPLNIARGTSGDATSSLLGLSLGAEGAPSNKDPSAMVLLACDADAEMEEADAIEETLLGGSAGSPTSAEAQGTNGYLAWTTSTGTTTASVAHAPPAPLPTLQGRAASAEAF